LPGRAGKGIRTRVANHIVVLFMFVIMMLNLGGAGALTLALV